MWGVFTHGCGFLLLVWAHHFSEHGGATLFVYSSIIVYNGKCPKGDNNYTVKGGQMYNVWSGILTLITLAIALESLMRQPKPEGKHRKRKRYRRGKRKK